MALDDTRADTGTIFYVRGSNHWPRAGAGRHVPRARRLARARARLDARRRGARARADRGARRRRRVPRRLDVPRQPAERARRRRAPLDHLPHGLDRHDAGATATPHPVYSRYRRPGRARARRGVLPRALAQRRPPLRLPRRIAGRGHPIVRGNPGTRRRGEPAAQRRVDRGVVEQRQVVRAADVQPVLRVERDPARAAAAGRARRQHEPVAEQPPDRVARVARDRRGDEAVRRARRAAAPRRRRRRAARRGRGPPSRASTSEPLRRSRMPALRRRRKRANGRVSGSAWSACAA